MTTPSTTVIPFAPPPPRFALGQPVALDDGSIGRVLMRRWEPRATPGQPWERTWVYSIVTLSGGVRLPEEHLAPWRVATPQLQAVT